MSKKNEQIQEYSGFEPSVSLEDVRRSMAQFAQERDWEQFHTPRNVLLALVGEVGELSEIFQWKGEVPPGLPGWSDEDREHVGRWCVVQFHFFCLFI